MASNLIEHSSEILAANKRDLEAAAKAGVKSSLIARLGLSEKKLQTLAAGLQQIAEKANILGLLNFVLRIKTKSFVVFIQDKLFVEHVLPIMSH
mgnify:FL=1